MKLTFKEYLESKEQLKNALANTPKTILEYEVRKYCTFPVGDSKEDSKMIMLKPKQKIIIEWHYNNLDSPVPNYIRFIGSNNINEDEEHTVFWSTAKIQKWLSRYTKKGPYNGYKV